MQQKIVIDTNIWVKAILDEHYSMECDDALSCFFQNENLVLTLDFQGEIEKEYRDNIKENRRFELRMKQLERENRKCWVDSKLTKQQERDLFALHFHEKEDHVFVGTAVNADKVLVTEDSDYGVHGEADKQEVYDYMKDKMSLTVLTGLQFYRKYKDEVGIGVDRTV